MSSSFEKGRKGKRKGKRGERTKHFIPQVLAATIAAGAASALSLSRTR